jgi:hypothetical protein
VYYFAAFMNISFCHALQLHERLQILQRSNLYAVCKCSPLLKSLNIVMRLRIISVVQEISACCRPNCFSNHGIYRDVTAVLLFR